MDDKVRQQPSQWIKDALADECAHSRISRGRRYDYCEECGAVRRSPESRDHSDEWHLCEICGLGK